MHTLLDAYIAKHNPVVAVIDGSDIEGCHTFFSAERPIRKVDVWFIREYGDVIKFRAPRWNVPKIFTKSG